VPGADGRRLFWPMGMHASMKKGCKPAPAALELSIAETGYSALRLRSQPTAPVPTMPSRTAAGAGIGATWSTRSIMSS
jgi:hypothetical protein